MLLLWNLMCEYFLKEFFEGDWSMIFFSCAVCLISQLCCHHKTSREVCFVYLGGKLCKIDIMSSSNLRELTIKAIKA